MPKNNQYMNKALTIEELRTIKQVIRTKLDEEYNTNNDRDIVKTYNSILFKIISMITWQEEL